MYIQLRVLNIYKCRYIVCTAYIYINIYIGTYIYILYINISKEHNHDYA